MKIDHGQYFWDFDNMFIWANFELRKDHAYILRGSSGQRISKPNHIKPNLALIDFHEIRYNKGQLVMWNSEEKRRGNAYPQSELHQKQITKLYEDYIFEKQILDLK